MRFVSPETVRIDLGSGDWIEVKQELTVGEAFGYETAGIGRKADDSVEINWKVRALARVEAYLVGWSDKRKPTREAIEALAREDFERMDMAIVAHIAAMAAAKKEPAGQASSTPA